MKLWLYTAATFVGLALFIEHTPPPAQKASAGSLKHLLAKYEAGGRGPNSYNRGSMRCAKSNRAHLPLTNMTIGQIQYYQSLPSCTHQKLLAVGEFQMVPDTLNAAVRALRIPSSARFTPELQNKLFVHYLAKQKQPAIWQYVRTGNDLTSACRGVSAEWAAFKDPHTGRGRYDSVGNNHARVSVAATQAALIRARNEYVRLTDIGLDPDTAYAAALGVPTGNTP